MTKIWLYFELKIYFLDDVFPYASNISSNGLVELQ